MQKSRIIPAAICSVGLVVGLIAWQLLAKPAMAQEAQDLLPINLTVSPATLQMNTAPGKPVTATVKVLNNNPVSETIKVSLGGFRADANGDKPVLYDFTEEDPEKDWLTANPSEVVVQPYSWESIEVTLSPDSNAAFSYYYALMFERTTKLEPGTLNPVQAIPAILVLSTIDSPNTIRAAELVSFTTKKKLYEFLPAEFNIIIENTGNVHVSPIGNIFISKGNEKNLAIINVNNNRGFILPESTRNYPASWEDGFPAYRPAKNEAGEIIQNKDGSTKYKLEWNPNFSTAFRLGKYTASLLMVYDDGTKDIPLERTLEFWVIPWKLIILIAIVLLLLLTGILMPIYTIGKKALRKQRKNP